jgi:hypothetical protein
VTQYEFLKKVVHSAGESVGTGGKGEEAKAGASSAQASET